MHREVVARGRLEVEVVGVVDGDRARARVDGERQLAVAVAVGVAGGDGPDERCYVVVAGVVDVDDGIGVGGRLGEVGRGVRDGQADVGDRDGDDLGVGGGAVGGLDREVVARGRLEVEVVRVVDGDRARGGADGERQLPSSSPSVLPFVMDHVRPVSPVVETVTTESLAEADSAMLAAVSVTVGATSVMVIVMSSVSAAVPSVALTVRS